MTKAESTISIETLRELVRLDPATGYMYWKERPVQYFANNKYRASKQEVLAKYWNEKHAGKRAFVVKDRSRTDQGSMMGKQFSAGRIAFALTHGHWPDHQIKHINGVKHDNRPENLIEHVKCCKDRFLPHFGVHRTKKSKWRAYKKYGTKTVTLGYYPTHEHAIKALLTTAA